MGTNSVVNYYCLVFIWHWKHLGIWQGNVTQFNESSTYLMGWLRDYLWLGSSQLINGYNPFGMNSLSVWSWVFLAGHLVWAKYGLSYKKYMNNYQSNCEKSFKVNLQPGSIVYLVQRL